jgi:hypothetical protein
MDGLLRLGVRLTAKRKNSININFLQQVPQSKHGLDLKARPYTRFQHTEWPVTYWTWAVKVDICCGTSDSAEFWNEYGAGKSKLMVFVFCSLALYSIFYPEKRR